METVHATCVAIDDGPFPGGSGVLLRGPSGVGKSDLALRLIDEGARLVADDQVIVARQKRFLTAHPPAALAGLIEIRGIGPVRMPHQPGSRVALVADLGSRAAIERLPEPGCVELAGVEVHLISLDPEAPSATARLRAVLKALARAGGDWPVVHTAMADISKTDRPWTTPV